MPIYVKLLSDSARLPERSSAAAAGMDLYSSADVTIEKGKRACIPTDISVAIDMGYYGRIAPRSGLASKHGIDVLAGVVDADYRGPVGVLLINLGESDYQVKKGDRIAQMIITPYLAPEIIRSVELPETDRGSGGWGSTGK